MFSFSKKNHLKYNSIEEWIKFEKIPTPFTDVQDEKLRDKYFTQLGDLRHHLFNKHLTSLSSEEQQLLKESKHPSQSHAFFKEAEKYLEMFKKEIPMLDCIQKIELGNYHMDRIIIMVSLFPGTDVAEVRKHIPQFYRGFEVLCGVRTKIK